ncbi:Alcohol dehydrogenase [NADP+] [Papilio xuthus]|uniref:Alcohol dehydrogenase [NADP+] n=1 Tax=Papilio xuthus TaxID=66420 RepID=A0A194PST4_PAPXU|nr:Alcohol dehydrogenase [NADP+] [Papilio xuthus]
MFVYKLFIFILTISATVASPSGPIQTFKLNDGRVMPGFGLGTWLGFISTSGNSKSQEVENAVKWAIDAGYRHIDTASIYDTEDQLNGTFYDVDYLETWEAMIAVQKKGLAKSIGVSNFNKAMLERLISNSSVKPANLQVEINLNLQQPELLEYCKEQNIVVTGYTPFGSIFPNKARSEAPPPRVDDPKLVDIAKKYNKTVPQIVLRYLVELNIIPIPKTITKSRVEQNIDIFDFKLTQEERDLFKSYDTNYRTIEPKMWQESPYYPFEMK